MRRWPDLATPAGRPVCDALMAPYKNESQTGAQHARSSQRPLWEVISCRTSLMISAAMSGFAGNARTLMRTATTSSPLLSLSSSWYALCLSSADEDLARVVDPRRRARTRPQQCPLRPSVPGRSVSSSRPSRSIRGLRWRSRDAPRSWTSRRAQSPTTVLSACSTLAMSSVAWHIVLACRDESLRVTQTQSTN